MGTRSYSELTWTLERTVLLPLGNTLFAEEFATVVTFHGFDRDFKADTADQRVFQFLVHLTIKDTLDVITTRREYLRRSRLRVGLEFTFLLIFLSLFGGRIYEGRTVQTAPVVGVVVVYCYRYGGVLGLIITVLRLV